MNVRKTAIFVVLLIAIISIIGYLIIKATYPFSVDDLSESYFNTLMLVKAILLGANLIADAGIVGICIYLSTKQRP